MKTVLTLCAAALLAAPLMADIGPKPRTTAPGLEFHPGDLKDVNVEMTSEEVNLVITRKDEQDTLYVTATFHMTNLGDEAAFEVGFPVGTHENMKSFKVTTDGVAHDITKIDRNPPKAQGRDERDSIEMHPHQYWYVWDAKYAAKAKVTHVVTYTVDIWHWSDNRYTGYILHSGAGWKNAIGKAVVTLSAGEGMTLDHLRDIGPKRNLAFKDNTYTWTFENLEPTAADNITISYNARISFTDEVAQLRSERDKYWDSRQELVYELSRASNRHGRADLNEAERAEYIDALVDLLSEMKEEDGKVIMPGKTTDKVIMSDDIDPEMRKMLEAMHKDQPRSYTYGHSLGTFFGNFGALLKVAAAEPGNEKALAGLEKWNKLAKAYLEGKFYADDKPIVVTSRGDKAEIEKKVKAHLAEYDKLMAQPKGD
jgi:hypothetical protein